MNAAEKRQAQRIIRNARKVERHLFELISSLQEGSTEGAYPFDWEEARHQLWKVQRELPLLFDLVANIQGHLITERANHEGV